MRERKLGATELAAFHCSGRVCTVKQIKALHIGSKKKWFPFWKSHGFGMQDVGYHYIILQDGTIVIGRGVNEVGAHVKGSNYRSVGICLIGDKDFTEAQFESARALMTYLRKQYPGIKVVGHYELLRPGDPPKSCPNIKGDRLRAILSY